MSDRNLCRAKRTDNGEWVEGYLYRLSEKNKPFIMLVNRCGEGYEVDPSTICQCMTADNKTIWENDIYQWVNPAYAKCTGIVRVGEYMQTGSGGEYPPIHCYGFYVEVLRVESLPWECSEEEVYYPDYLKTISVFEMFEENSDVKLIGNIFDHPDLVLSTEEK